VTALANLPALDARRATLVVTAVAGVLHLLMAGSLPLIVTPDGGEYVRGAVALGKGAGPWVELNRTPGYPVLLAAIFAVFGVGAGGVLIVQNLLATATCALITYTACRIATPWAGLVVGLAYALEPWSLALANYVLTETASAFAVALAVTLVLCWRRATVAAAAVIGATLAAACLMRPAIQSMVPFFALAWVLGLPVAPRRRTALLAAAVGVLLLCCLPWLVFNASRGVRGFAGMSGSSLWYGVAMAGLLDRAHPLDERTRDAVERFLPPGSGDPEVHRVIFATDAYRSVEQSARLGAWARASIARRPLGYARAAWDALRWQLGAGAAGRPPMYDEMPFFLDRLTWDAHDPPRGPANFQNPGELPKPWAFTVGWHGGVLQAYMRRAARAPLHGIPQVPLLVCALAATALAAWRRDWAVALVLLGTLAFVAAHAALLLPVARHALPAWTVWYVGAADLLGVAVRRATTTSWRSSPGA
jgi:4-amino-4-deoxy-L-arabinose transferase-like glycosyltransferase